MKLLFVFMCALTLVACGGGGGVSTLMTAVSADSSKNVAPISRAGAAQNVIVGTSVTLDASKSTAASGKTLTYSWTLRTPQGSVTQLVSPGSPMPTFVADISGDFVASVVVYDGTKSSDTATVTVSASIGNAAPVSNSGVAQNVVVGSLVILDGSASSDANGDPLTFVWTLTGRPAGSTATLSSSTFAKPMFTADVAGIYIGTLIVNDGKVNSTAVTVSITAAIANVAPVANAGNAQNVYKGAVVTLDGTSSSDAKNHTLTYAWTLTGNPGGSAATLSSSTSARPTFTADVAGTYVGTLIVNNGRVNSTAATVSITATEPTLTLYEVSTSFFSSGDTLAPMPYSLTASTSETANCVGSRCPTIYDVASFKLIASGQTFTISNLSAVNLTNGSSLVPVFSGLTNGQLIANGTTVPFNLQSPFTSYATVQLKYSFTVVETGKTFNYMVTLHTN